MLKRSRLGLWLVASLLPGIPLHAEIIEQVLVKVNGDIVTKTEFEQRQVAALRNRPEFADASPSNLQLQRAIAEIAPDLILEAVDELLLVQRGRELNYTLGDEQFKQIVDNIRKQNNIEDEQRFQAALKQEGLTMADLRRNLERSMLVSQVQRVDVMEKISVTDTESRAYYDAHRQDFTSPSEITLREILIPVPASDRGVNVAQDDEARAKADDLRARIVAGEPFPRLAAEFSGSASKANGGLIGPIISTELAPQLQQMLDRMKVGELTPVIRTQPGYQILKLESRTETKIRTYDEARDDIADRVAETKRRAELEKYLDRLRAQATITWRNDELEKAYNQALAKRRQASAASAPAAGAQ
jgi:peptidyl-prolyl cis-trans isomerase SurA